MNFDIDEKYICDVTIRTEYDYIKDRNNPTHDDLIKILKGWDKGYSISNKDHDEFTKLRNKLEELGYIETQRGWWNGDRVLKPFTLNNKHKFRKGHKFPCAAALQSSIRYCNSKGKNYVSSY